MNKKEIGPADSSANSKHCLRTSIRSQRERLLGCLAKHVPPLMPQSEWLISQSRVEDKLKALLPLTRYLSLADRMEKERKWDASFFFF